MARSNDSLTAALALAQRGYAVFPCHYVTPDGVCSCGDPSCKNVAKHPMTPNGCKDASSDPAAVERMFRGSRSRANIGLATGPQSGIWVLDVEAAGLPILDQLQREHCMLPTTVSSITGGGGRHEFFKWNGIEIRNKTKIGGKPIDCRGIGGYVVVPPSNHKSWRHYRWEHDPETTLIAEAPAWLVEFVTSRTSTKPTVVSVGTSTSMIETLATAGGVGEGRRHAKALELIGREIGFGTSKPEVLRLALAWGARCTPAMPEAEVERIVEDLTSRHVSKPQADISRITGSKPERSFQQQAEAAIEEAALDAPIPEPTPWPTLDDAALYGLAGEIVRTIEPETEADPVAILAQLIISFGNMVGREPYFVVEGSRHHANEYAVLVGTTSRGRKGTSEGRVRQILQAVDEPWVLGNIKTGCVSGEGLIWNVRDPIYKLENIKDKGRVVGTEEVLADPGISDKRLFVQEPEFASVLRVCRREQNTLSAVLRSAWDSGILRTLAKNSPATATDAHISIVGHITSEELHQALAEVDGFNGFANRFLWVSVRRSKLLPDGGRDLDLTHHAERLALAAEQARSVGRMYRDQGATALWRRVYAELADDNPGGLLAAVTSRAEAHVLRLSMIYALLDGRGTITERHLLAALALWRYSRSSAAMIFGDVAADPVEQAVLAAITQAPGISRRELHKALGGHTKAAALNEILTRLRNANKIRLETIETATKPAERWFPCEQREHSEQFGTVGTGTCQQQGDCSECSNNSQHRTDTNTPDAGDCSNNSHCSQQDQNNGTDQDQDQPDGYEPTYCRGCHKLLIDQQAEVVSEFHWLAGAAGGDYCRACYEAGRVVDTLTGRRILWHGPDYKVGTSMADEPEPEPGCTHHDPSTFVHRDGKAYCRVCDRYMGRTRT